ncbi:MAG: restriction endonuclease subunit S [Catenibacterium mitsuokai]|nr:restriction endonuclease subunit S [Catenibacterium mitsuokai]MBN2931022.1 restriction endonuclease subunit S [Catenibacterium mitsuokai]
MKIKIGDITKIRTGKLDANVADENGQYPFFTCSKEPLKINTYSYDCECVLVAGNGDLNVKYYNGKFDAYQRTYIIEDDSDGLLFMPYLYCFMESYIDELRKQSIGGVIKYIKLKNLTDALIELPSIEVQRKIVNIIFKSKEIVRRKENEFELLDELVRARFVEMFGDPNIEFKYSSVKFNDLVARMTKGPFGSDMKKDLFVPKGEDTYKVYIQINAIQKNQSLGEYYISKEYFDRKVSRFELFPNDYIITCDGTLGKYLKLDENMEKGVISPSLLRLTLQNDKINDKYFENIWDFYMLGLMKKEARNACLVHLPSAKKIGEISIPVPPLELQNQFASFVQEIDKSRLLNICLKSLVESVLKIRIFSEYKKSS